MQLQLHFEDHEVWVNLIIFTNEASEAFEAQEVCGWLIQQTHTRSLSTEERQAFG